MKMSSFPGNKIGDMGFKAIGDGLAVNKTLTKLDLISNE